MPKTAKPLSAREVATIKKPGTYFDGHGLALRVGPTDLGKVIGREGKTAHALRTLLSAAATALDRRAVLEIAD